MSKKNFEIKGTKRILASLVLGMYVLSMSPALLFANENKQTKAENEAFINAAKAKINQDSPKETFVEESSEQLITVNEGGVVVLGKAKIEIPEGALKKDTTISITHLREVAKTGDSLYNAIPSARGYRFLPAGTKFKKTVTVTLPYDPSLNSKPQSLEDLYTYFYDTKKKMWVKLERVEVDRENCLVKSLTTHFTDMINATLTLPETANPVDVNLNSIKNLEAAKPDSHLIKFNPPKASSSGDANFSFELQIPSGRQGVQPQLSVSYSSDGGNGIMGKGFDIRYGSSITTDTRFGLPTYNSKKDTYMLDGIILELDTNNTSSSYDLYIPKKESSFERIRHYTDKNYWEVTSRDGTRKYYGDTENSYVGKNQNEKFTWNLTKVKDIYSNTVEYLYEKDAGNYVVIKTIKYTANEKLNDKPHYFIDFNYSEDRKDIRIDARSKDIVECRKLLTGIDVTYQNQDKQITQRIISYNFIYEDGIAAQKMLTALEVVNAQNESYAYSFDYNKPGDYFGKTEKYAGAEAIQTGNSTSFGANFNASAGVGYGLRYLDARLTAGTSGSASSGESYSEDSMIDINGDGMVDCLYTDNNKKLWVALNNGKSFDPPKQIQITETIGKESNSSTSIGWNAYGGIGVKGNFVSATAGASYAQTYQNSTSNTESSFMDMDGDGLVDIVIAGESTYLKNKGNCEFVKTNIYKEDSLEISNVSQVLSDQKKQDYKDTYYIQTPFREWKIPYDGFINITETTDNKDIIGYTYYSGYYSKDSINREKIYSQANVENLRLKVNQGNSLYFISDVGDDPKGKDFSWNIKISYVDAKIFDNKNYKSPVFFKSIYEKQFEDKVNTLKSLSGRATSQKDSKAQLDAKINETLENFDYFFSKHINNFTYDYTTESVTEEGASTSTTYYIYKVANVSYSFSYSDLINEGLFLPGVLTPQQFELYKSQLYFNGDKDIADFYTAFSSQYVYSVIDEVFVLRDFSDKVDAEKNPDSANYANKEEYNAYKFFEQYTPNYNTLIDKTNNITFKDSYFSNYNINNLTADFSTGSKVYTNKNTFNSQLNYRTGSNIGDSFRQNNQQYLVIGKYGDENLPLIINISTKELYTLKDKTLVSFGKAYLANTDSNTKDIKIVLHGKNASGEYPYTLNIESSGKTDRALNITDEEYENICSSISDFEGANLYSINDECWSWPDDKRVLKEDIEKELRSHISFTDADLVSFRKAMYVLTVKPVETTTTVYNEKTKEYEEKVETEYIYYYKIAKSANKTTAGKILSKYKKAYVKENIFNFYDKDEQYENVLNEYWRDENGKNKYISDFYDEEELNVRNETNYLTTDTIPNQITFYSNNIDCSKFQSDFDQYTNMPADEITDDFIKVIKKDLKECYELYVAKVTHNNLLNSYNTKLALILKKSEEFNLCKYNTLKYTLDYIKDYSYPIKSDNILITVLNENGHIKEEKFGNENTKWKWDSADFNTTNRNITVKSYDNLSQITSKQPHEVYFYEQELENEQEQGNKTKVIDCIAVSSDSLLYGGNDNWFYGIWEGDVNNFSSSKFVFNNEKNNLSDEDIKNNQNNNINKVSELGENSPKQEKKVSFSLPTTYNNSPMLMNNDKVDYILPGYTDNKTLVKDGLIGNPAIDSKSSVNTKGEKVYLQYLYVPFINGDYIHCNRAGGNAYYSIDGLYTEDKGSEFTLPKIRKTYTTGTDITPSVSMEIGGIEEYTVDKIGEITEELENNTTASAQPFGSLTVEFGTNKSDSKVVQSIMDINGDGIPDILQINDSKDSSDKNSLNVIYGSRYVDDTNSNTVKFLRSTNFNEPKYISFNYSDTKVKGGSAGIGGAIAVVAKANAKRAMTIPKPTPSPSAGLTKTTGTSKQTQGLIEFNGDGLPDYSDGNNVYINTGDNFVKYENGFTKIGDLTQNDSYSTARNFSISMGTTKSIDTTKANSLSNGVSATLGASFSASSSNATKMMLDINGDGLTDIVSMTPGSEKLKVQYNTGTGYENAVEINLPLWDLSKFTEYNASASPFMYQNDNNGFDMGLITDLPIVGDAVKGFSKAVAINPYGSESNVNSYINALDWNTSVTLGLSGSVGANVNIGIDIWATFVYCGTVNITVSGGAGINTSSTINGVNVSMTDLNGDGLPDHVMRIPGIGTYWKKNLCGTFGQLTGINTPNGGKIQIEYKGQIGDCNMPGFKYVMESVTVYDGCTETSQIAHKNHSITTNFEYSQGYYDRTEKESYGFKYVTTKTKNLTTIEEYYQDSYAVKGMVLATETKDNKGHTISYSKTVPYCMDYKSNPTWVMPVKEESITYEPSDNNSFITTSSIYTYDGNGLCVSLKQTFDDNNYLEAIFEYTSKGSAEDYITGLPSLITVKGSDNTTRIRKGEYNEYGKLKKLFQYSDDYNYSYHELSYDKYGNIEILIQRPTEADSEGRKIKYSYSNDPTKSFVTGINQYLTESEYYESKIDYDPVLQVKTKETDCNGNTLTYIYDSWKRPLEIRTLYDTGDVPAVKYSYSTPSAVLVTRSLNDDKTSVNITNNTIALWNAVTDNKVSFNANDETVIQTVVETDGMGRAVRTAKTGYIYDTKDKSFKNGWNVSGLVEYDEMGRTVKEGMTYFIEGDIKNLLKTKSEISELFTAYEYDAQDRIVKTTLPVRTDNEEDTSLGTTTVSYTISEGKLITKSQDPYGQITIQESDSRGNITAVKKYSPENSEKPSKLLSTVSYEYNTMSEMIKAFNVESRPVTVTYDWLGRRTSIESKDSGKQEFRYDNMSNLVAETNSVLKSQEKEISYKYDILGRIEEVSYPYTQKTTYEYGKPSDKQGAAGKIKKVTDESGSTEYTYGYLGQTTSEHRIIKTHLHNSSDMQSDMSYESDYLGRMQSITYPDGEKITYSYDAGGQVNGIKGVHGNGNFVYVQNIGYDQYGQRIFITYGNGVSTTYEYDESRRWLKNIETSNGSQQFQNIRYSFDDVGNVKKYVNNCLEGTSGNYSTTQQYGYDDLYQLISVKGTSTYNPSHVPVAKYESTYEQKFNFDNTYAKADESSQLLGRMTSKVSSEYAMPSKLNGDDLNYKLDYVYDDDYSYRLIRAGDHYYKYDLNGNVISERTGQFEDTDLYTLKINDEGNDVYSTDYAWGTARKSDSSASSVKNYQRDYKWNEKNLLINSNDGVYNTSYVYGQDGNRSNKYTDISETVYFNNMWVYHMDEGNLGYGGQYVKNIYLGDTRILTKLNSGNNFNTYTEELAKQYYYHGDHLGSASVITDAKGNEYQRLEYTPYGETWVEFTSNLGSENLPYKFSAKEMDEETGLYYYGARYLDPKYSMWLSTDPALGEYIPGAGKANSKDFGNLPGMGGVFNHINFNLYHYAGNNPVKYTDPDGKISILAAVEKIAQTISFITSLDTGMPLGGSMVSNQSLYQQQYSNQQDEYDMNSIVFSVMAPIEGALTGDGGLISILMSTYYNYADADKSLVTTNIDGFIIGAQKEISRIDAVLDICSTTPIFSDDAKNSSFKKFLIRERTLLSSELKINQEVSDNLVYSTFGGTIIDKSTIDFDVKEGINYIQEFEKKYSQGAKAYYDQ